MHRHIRRTAVALTPLVAAGAILAAPAVAAAPSIHEIEAELKPGGRLALSTETRGATRVTFSIAGRSAKGYLTDTDAEDGTRDYERNIASRGMKPGVKKITVRACGNDGCTTRSVRQYVEFDD